MFGSRDSDVKLEKIDRRFKFRYARCRKTDVMRRGEEDNRRAEVSRWQIQLGRKW